MVGDAAVRRPQSGPTVWRSGDLVGRSDWMVELTDAQRDQIVAATRVAAEADQVDAASFPLGDLADEVARWSEVLATGPGIVGVRGFPVDLLDAEEVELAYLGLGAHLGTPVGQNKQGEILTHIRDERLPEGTEHVRRYRTRLRQDFHTDGADIVGLLCLHRSVSGGESRVASAGTVYNELLARRPDLLEVLYRPFHWDRQGEQAPGEEPWFELAPLNDLDGQPRFFYLGWYIRDAQRHGEVPRLTDQQIEAMDLLEAIANDPAVHVEMDFQPGDVQWINNGRVLHAREAYMDADDLAERRHLLRLWLAAHRFTSVEPELRAGLGGDGR
jgi:hypothetical protein